MIRILRLFAIECRNGLRQLLRRSAYSALIVAVLSVGLGATLFVLVALDAMILRPLPFPHSDRLFQVGETSDNPGALDAMNSQDLLELRGALTQFESLQAYSGGTMNIADNNGVERYDGQFVSGGLFELLGSQAQLGRTLAPGDDAPAANLRVVISDRVWRQRFAADPAVIGRAVRLNSQPAEIIGVMPPRFAFPFRSDVWTAARYAPMQPIEQQRDTDVIGLLRAGASADSAAAELVTVWSRLQLADPATRRDVTLALLPLAHQFVGAHTRTMVGVLLISALSVLLVACANVANLQLANLSQRSRELALRAAIGATRGRLLIGLLAETLVLAVIATLIALLIADWAGVQTMRSFVEAGDGPAYWIDFRITPRLALFGVVIAVLTTALAGLVPGLRASGFQLHRTIVDNGRSGTGASRVARALIIAQVALSCVLLIGAGMVWRLLAARSSADFGIDTPAAELLTARIGIFPEQYPTAREQVAFFERVAERVRSEPGVRDATIAEALPGSTAGAAELLIEGEDPEAPRPEVLRSAIDDHFGSTYGVTPVLGRMPDARDNIDSARVAVIDQRFVDRFWPRQEPLNRRFKLGQDDSAEWITVIGVVPTLQLEDVDDSPLPSVLLPMRQAAVRFATLAVHTAAEPTAFAPRLAEIVRSVDPNTPVYWLRTLAQTLAADRVGDRFLSRLFALFGLTGLLLAGAGMFGLLAQVVQTRTREIGVRRAIGANQRQVFRLITADSSRLVLIGLAFGLLLAVPWALMLSNNAVGLNPFDPLIYGSVIALVLGAGAIAVIVPTRRALGIAPSEALRSE